MAQQFSPAYLSSLVVKPLRYFFENYAPEDLCWNPDEKNTMIEIDTINNFNKIPVQTRPRILISRGQYSISPTGLSDNLAQGIGMFAGKGLRDQTNLVMLQGVIQVMVSCRNEGTTEKVIDLLQHFIAWTGPMIANAQGFKNFAQAVNVSPCTPSREDTELFTCTMNLPWSKEEAFRVSDKESVKIKNFILSITD